MNTAVQQRQIDPLLGHSTRLKIMLHPREPSGQRNSFIPSGDLREEACRYFTFKNFPRQIDTMSLVKKGFFYTGYNDRIKCFSCGSAVENLLSDGDWNFTNWHRNDCEFLCTNSAGNVPFGVEGAGASSPIPSAPHQTPTGEEVLRNTDHQGQRAPQSTTLHTSSNNQEGERNNSSVVCSDPIINQPELFHCRNPMNPHMRSSEVRLQTFADRAMYWPAYRINTTPRDIATAGFYYLGERDRVKCWYCNGGLQNWDRDDDAWTEHAKWFPMCEFLLQQKGPEFVHSIVSQFPNLRRPTLYNPPMNELPSSATQRAGSSAAVQSAPQIIDPRRMQSERLRKVERDMTSSQLVAEAQLMGFSDDVIRKALKTQYETHDEGFSSFAAMVDAMVEVEDVSEEAESQPVPTSSNELERLIQSRLCKVCHQEESCMVFVPCGHLACCRECGERARRCPVCNSSIGEKIRSYIS